MAFTKVLYPLKRPLTRIFDDKMQKVLERIGGIILENAVIRCPKDTGRLSNSIQMKVFANEGLVVVGTNVEYAKDVEYGTEVMVAAHGPHDPMHPVKNWRALRMRHASGSGQTMPFLRPAVFFNKDRIQKEASEALAK